MRLAGVAKGAKKEVVGLSMKKKKIRGNVTNGRRRHVVNHVDHCVKGLRPKSVRDRRMSHEGETHLNDVKMFPLWPAVLVRHMRI